ncbi:MFS_YcxA_like domain containing protein [Rhabdaerophilaceae bacterium]
MIPGSTLPRIVEGHSEKGWLFWVDRIQNDVQIKRFHRSAGYRAWLNRVSFFIMNAHSDQTSLTPPPMSGAVKRAILGLGVTQIIGWGTTYYLLSLLGSRIVSELALPKAVVLFGVSLTLLASAALGPMVGRWQDRRGSREVMACGSALVAAGLLVIAVSRNVETYIFGWLIVAIGTPMALYLAAFTALTQLAGKQARQAIIYLTFMGGLASTVSWPGTAALLTITDWRGVVMIFAALNLMVCLPIHVVVLGGSPLSNNGAEPSSTISPGLTKAASRPAFLLLAAMLAINSLIFNAWSLLVFPVLEGLGFVGGIAVFVASLVGICQVVGRMGEMLTGERFTAFQTAGFAVYLLPASFIVLMFSAGNFWIGCLFALAYGISNGLMTIARGALTLSIFGSHGFGEQLGKITVASGLMGAAAPVIGGFVLEAASPLILVYGLIFFASLSAVLMVILRWHCRRHGLH